MPLDPVPCPTAVHAVRPRMDHAASATFGEFWSRHREAARRRCLFLMKGRPEDAEEALSRAALSALRHSLTEPTLLLNERAWVLRLAANACFDVYREQKRRRETSLEGLAVAPIEGAAFACESPEKACLDAELQHYLRACIRALPLRLRESARLRLLEEKPYPDIARDLGITQDNARKRVQEARKVLRLAIDAYRRGAAAAMAGEPLHAKRPRPV